MQVSFVKCFYFSTLSSLTSTPLVQGFSIITIIFTINVIILIMEETSLWKYWSITLSTSSLNVKRFPVKLSLSLGRDGCLIWRTGEMVELYPKILQFPYRHCITMCSSIILVKSIFFFTLCSLSFGVQLVKNCWSNIFLSLIYLVQCNQLLGPFYITLHTCWT